MCNRICVFEERKRDGIVQKKLEGTILLVFVTQMILECTVCEICIAKLSPFFLTPFEYYFLGLNFKAQ